MMLMKNILILLALFIHYTEGFETVILVAELDNMYFDDDKDNVVGSGSTSVMFSDLCCVHGNCSCSSLYSALAILTSNIMINITTDVELSSSIPIVNLSNIMITGHGHNYPTVHCNNSGGLHFISCNNCTIEGIIWEGCGAKSDISDDDNSVYPLPVLQFNNSSNITIQNCSFQQSIGQAVVLPGMSGDVNIN